MALSENIKNTILTLYAGILKLLQPGARKETLVTFYAIFHDVMMDTSTQLQDLFMEHDRIPDNTRSRIHLIDHQ